MLIFYVGIGTGEKSTTLNINRQIVMNTGHWWLTNVKYVCSLDIGMYFRIAVFFGIIKTFFVSQPAG